MAPWKFLIYGFVVLGIASLVNIGLAFDDGNSASRGSSSGARSWSSGSSSSGWSFGGGHK